MRANEPLSSMVLATSNPHKVREFREILTEGLGLKLEPLADAQRARGLALDEPVEDGATFGANARLKARYYARALDTTCLADDSGLEVDALGGAPGVLSARYAGASGPREERDQKNNQKLMAALEGVPTELRQARFVCAIAVARPDGDIVAESRGEYAGVITTEPRGQGGFGYDPLLYVPELGCTSAELSPQEKHRRSHRGKALRELCERLALTALE